MEENKSPVDLFNDEISTPTVDMLLDNEKSDIENALVEKFQKQPKSEVIYDDVENNPLKGKKKYELISDVRNLEEKLGKEVTAESKLNRLTKVQLSKKLAELMNESILGEKVEENESEERIQVTANMSGIIAENMYAIHSVLISGLEVGVNSLSDKTGGIELFKGLSKKNEDRKNQFIPVFRQLYEKYKNQIDDYVNPVALYIAMIGGMCTETAVSNYSKKKTNSEEES